MAQSSIVTKVAKVLDVILSSPMRLSYSQITKEVGLPKSTAHRILSILVEESLITLDPVRNLYHPGPMILRWASNALNANDLPEIATSTLVALSAATQASVGISILDGENILWLKMVEQTVRHRHSPRVGDRAPAHATAAGKALLAFVDPVQRASSLRAMQFTPFTAQTITAPDIFDAELVRVVKAGVATSNREEFLLDVGIAAPIYDHMGDCVAAISLWDTTGIRELSEVLEHKARLLRAAAEISRQLGLRDQARLNPPAL
jgi:DNA-binding IclR family transcriptional regulator